MWASLAKLGWIRFAELCCECSAISGQGRSGEFSLLSVSHSFCGGTLCLPVWWCWGYKFRGLMWCKRELKWALASGVCPFWWSTVCFGDRSSHPRVVMLCGTMWRSGVEPVSQYSVVSVEAVSVTCWSHLSHFWVSWQANLCQTCAFGYKCSNFRGWHDVQYCVVSVPVIGRQVEVVSFSSLLSFSQLSVLGCWVLLVWYCSGQQVR